MNESLLPQSVKGSGGRGNKKKVETDTESDGNESSTESQEVDELGVIESMMGLIRLKEALANRFDRLRQPEDIRNAIRCLHLAMSLAFTVDVNTALLLADIGELHHMGFEYLGEIKDINKWVGYLSQAMLVMADEREERPSVLNSLGVAYASRFERLGDVADVDNAIKCQMQAVQRTTDGHEDRPGWLSNLGISYLRRFEHCGAVSDVENAIKCQMEAVKLTLVGHAERPARLNNLGNAYRCRFERYGDIADIDNGIKCQMQATHLTPDGHSDRPGCLNDLGNSYMCRFERYGDVGDVDKAIKCQMQAVKLTPDDHAGRPGRLNNLGSSYMRRFERHGDVTDVNNAIECQMEAMQLTPSGHAGRPGLLNNLGSSYMRRFERHGNVADVDDAIKWHMQAVQMTPDGHTDKPARLNNLGSSYRCRFERHGDVADVDNAIGCQMQAVQLTPDGHADRPGWLNNLGLSYMRRFEHHGHIADVDNAIECQMQAVQLTPDGHVDRPACLNNLGNSYMCRFERLEEGVADIENGINNNAHPAQFTPESPINKPDRLKQLAHPQDLEASITAFKQAAQSLTGDSQIRFEASLKWARCSRLFGISPRSAYHRAMELVPQLVWLGSTIKQRYNLLPEIGDAAMEAASCAIALREFDCALEWLEQGRSVVWNQVLQLRTSFDDLHNANPELANRLKQVAQRLERAGTRVTTTQSSSDGAVLEAEAQQHRLIAVEWERLLSRARGLPGFGDFLQPRKATELICAAKDGPIIVINIHQDHCDALVIQPSNDTISHVPLDNLSPQKLAAAHSQFMAFIGCGARHRGLRLGAPVDARHRFKMMLAILWMDIVKPIFDFLGYTHQRSIEQLPHVTWCTTGPLSFLPLHAAGCYDQSQPNVIDYVVSSYTPTLGALLSSSNSAPIRSVGILAVGQQYTEGHCNLPCTKQELAAIKENTLAADYMQLEGSDATVNVVLAAMEKCNWVHLACHAAQDRQDPTQSAFLLHDGNLSLATITQRSFKNKGLAFLSACQTATGDEKLPDEAVHLAAGMQMAGYPSVIATMWSIQDEDAPEVARQVYVELLRDGKMDVSRAARALHRAVVGLREKVGVDRFERWMPFIHIGC